MFKAWATKSMPSALHLRVKLFERKLKSLAEKLGDNVLRAKHTEHGNGYVICSLPSPPYDSSHSTAAAAPFGGAAAPFDAGIDAGIDANSAFHGAAADYTSEDDGVESRSEAGSADGAEAVAGGL